MQREHQENALLFAILVTISLTHGKITFNNLFDKKRYNGKSLFFLSYTSKSDGRTYYGEGWKVAENFFSLHFF